MTQKATQNHAATTPNSQSPPVRMWRQIDLGKTRRAYPAMAARMRLWPLWTVAQKARVDQRRAEIRHNATTPQTKTKTLKDRLK